MDICYMVFIHVLGGHNGILVCQDVTHNILVDPYWQLTVRMLAFVDSASVLIISTGIPPTAPQSKMSEVLGID